MQTLFVFIRRSNVRKITTKRIVSGLASALLMVATWFVDGEVQDDQIKEAVRAEIEKLKKGENDD
jgi:hypothetical protein